MPKISALPPAGSLEDDDETPFVDDSASETKKFTLAGLLVWLQSKTSWISNAMIANDTIKGAKINFAATGADNGIWWEELGRTTLGVAGDTISVTGIPARKYLRALVAVTTTGGTAQCAIRFNNDSGGNYDERSSTNGAADATLTGQSGIVAAVASAAPRYIDMSIINVANLQKLVRAESLFGENVATAPARQEVIGKWTNTSAQISRMDIINVAGSGDFAIGSEVVILGHN